MTPLSSIPVTKLRGVGERTAQQLQKLNLFTAQDLLFHLPLHYQDRRRITPLNHLKIGESFLIEGSIQSVSLPPVYKKFRGSKKTTLSCIITDGKGFLTLRFFHLHGHLQQQLKPGKNLRGFGEVRMGHQGWEMIHPELQAEETLLPDHLTPVYPTTEGLHHNKIRLIIQQALMLLQQTPEETLELLPEKLLHQLNAGSLKQAIFTLHQPRNLSELQRLDPRLRGDDNRESGDDNRKSKDDGSTLSPLHRLAIEELMAHHLSLLKTKALLKTQQALPLTPQTNLIQQFIQQLPFQLTNAQKRAFTDIQQDLKKIYPKRMEIQGGVERSKPQECSISYSTGVKSDDNKPEVSFDKGIEPMHRLIQGDVGSGKTLVAALAALLAVDNHQQVAIMAPTEILAEQHWLNFSRWLAPLNISLVWLTGKIKGAARKQTLENIADGTAKIIIGTHALFQEAVEYHSLALIIIDEQHRFGVEQRLSLRNKGHCPHQLMMTATPIPRTLSMTFYVDLDTSIIDELPPGRQPITTAVLSADRRTELLEKIRQICQQGRQVYWVCTLIEESDILTCEAAQSTYEKLQALLPELKIGLVHGQLKPTEKAQIMDQFKQGEFNLLVATTVIEVGVDVPNATLMIIENAERLGLAQLHQLRGRVGRGDQSSYCILLYQMPLSAIGKQRLAYMRESQDGFYLAEKDLELRGPGDMLGTRQTGELHFHIADIMRDQHLLPKAKQAADYLLKNFPEKVQPLIDRWLRSSEDYLRV